MLQVALGGTYLIGTGSQLINDPVYYEPGFNIMTPLEIETVKADIIYILIRKRVDSLGESFRRIPYSSLEVSVVDATINEGLTYTLSDNTINPRWDDDPSDVGIAVLTIENQLDTANPVLRSRIIDCTIKHKADNSFITFRITVTDEGLYFHYIPIIRTQFSDRNTFTASGREAYVNLSNSSDAYVLFSPFAYLEETTKELSDFSYPIDSIYYKRENTLNNEDFTFSLSSYDRDFIPDQLSVMNIPGYGKAGIVLIDAMLYKKIFDAGVIGAYVDIGIVGELSGITDTFRINFRI